jgi:hypothetical protein
MALKLVEGHYLKLVHLLRCMQANAAPMSTRMLAATWPMGNGKLISHERGVVMSLKALRRAGMVKRSSRADCVFWYTLTELGEMVCLYLPLDEGNAATKNTRSPSVGKIQNAFPTDGGETHTPPDEHKVEGDNPVLDNQQLEEAHNQPGNQPMEQTRKRGRPRKTLVAADSA